MTIHNSKEWKLKADEFKKGKVCEWCGADKFLHVHHPDPDSTHKRNILNHAYREFKREFSKKYPRKRVIDIKTGKVTYPKNKDAPDFKREFVKWKKEYKIDKIIDEAHKKYLSLEGCIVLCRKCHIAAEHGKNLCPICKSKYKLCRYETCFNCISQDKKDEIVSWQESMDKEAEIDEEAMEWIDEYHKVSPKRRIEMEKIADKKERDYWDCESFEDTEEYKQQCVR